VRVTSLHDSISSKKALSTFAVPPPPVSDINVFVEQAFVDGFLGKDTGDFGPLGVVVCEL
jgi:hypothetical protein